MEILISSDTNVWIDLREINCLRHSMALPFKFYISRLTFDTEFVDIADEIENLMIVDLLDDELNKVIELTRSIEGLSTQDCAALILAEERGWVLLSGDKLLRNTAQKRNIPVIGTLCILDNLLGYTIINEEEYKCCLKQILMKMKTGIIRLPEEEVHERMKDPDSYKFINLHEKK